MRQLHTNPNNPCLLRSRKKRKGGYSYGGLGASARWWSALDREFARDRKVGVEGSFVRLIRNEDPNHAFGLALFPDGPFDCARISAEPFDMGASRRRKHEK